MFPIRWNKAFRKKDGSLTTIGAEIDSGGGGGQYELPTASANTKGGVKIGNGLTMTGEVLSATGGQASVTPNYTTGRLECGTSGDYAYYIKMSREFIGTAIDGYEFDTTSATSSRSSFDLNDIKYTGGAIVDSTKLIELVHNGQNTFENDDITISYDALKWNVVLKKSFYKTDGTQWASPIQWDYDQTVDYILLESNPA